MFCGFRFCFGFAMKWRKFNIPVSQIQGRWSLGKESYDSSDSSECEYRTILFDNIKPCPHLYTFFWFNRSVESVSLISFLAAATRMLKSVFVWFDFYFFFNWENICGVSWCACNHLYFVLAFCSWGGFHLEQKWKHYAFSLSQMPWGFNFLSYFKNMFIISQYKSKDVIT